MCGLLLILRRKGLAYLSVAPNEIFVRCRASQERLFFNCALHIVTNENLKRNEKLSLPFPGFESSRFCEQLYSENVACVREREREMDLPAACVKERERERLFV